MPRRAAWRLAAAWLVVIAVATTIGAARAAADNEDCLACHGDADLAVREAHRPGTSVLVDFPQLEASMHEGMDCIDCHPDAEAADDEDHPARLQPAVCADCHDEVAAEYAESLHGQALARGEADAPRCADCHGGHDIRAADDPASMVHRQRIPATCATCHADLDFIERRPVHPNMPLDAYRLSDHYRSLVEDGEGATCTDCHGAHAMFARADPRSSINHANIAATCGDCHAEIAALYADSIHGRAVAHGNLDAPSCPDCHGEHEIRGPDDPQSSVFPSHVARTTCVWCHESERISKRYGLSAGRLSTFLDSYHGLAVRGGSTTVANCASCHGVHDIRPSSDPLSSVHAANLPQTCGKCHPGAGDNFAIGTIHVDPTSPDGEHPVVRTVRTLYLYLIVVVIGTMAVHNGADFFRRFSLPRFPRGRDVLRFTPGERLQHAALAIAFIVLAYSGFALEFPDAWWAAPFTWVGSGEASRRVVHRAAALLMLGIGVVHLGYLAFSRRGREQGHAMWPRGQDVRDLAQMLRFYAGRGPQPRFDRFGYIEKVEYWALLWGAAVMTITGFALWLANLTLRLLPKWVLDLATVVHYYEAWLATLAIVVWHFYWVIFNPQVYPMSLVWLHGYLSREAMAHEHPRELERLEQPAPAAAADEPPTAAND